MTHNKPSPEYGEVRIIGGKWRGRKLRFPAITGLRPTPDRVRETLFNWLAPYIVNANCLDLFAGSGALGLEALSRGADSVTFVDQSQQIATYLKQQLKILAAENGNVHCAKFPFFTKQIMQQNFAIVFLDPPFQKNLIQPTCEWLEQEKLLAPNALIYIETETELNPLAVPNNWQVLRSKTAGQVAYHLLQRA